MTIGLPRALLYYKYRYLWEIFFKELGCRVIVSEKSSSQTLADGSRFSIDECCLSSKMYMGHVYSLIGHCDYVLVLRVENFGRKEKVCVKFNAMYDIVKNTFKDVPLLCYDVDVEKGNSELKGFLQMGKVLGKSCRQSFFAYQKGKRAQMIQDKQKAEKQLKLLENQEQLKILLVTHPYNIYDKLIGFPIVKLVEESGGMPVYADACDSTSCRKESEGISKSLNWTFNKELVGAMNLCKEKVDGIILITAFPCGPDSLVNELILRRFKHIPISHIILDELTGEAGLQTRIESFMDIIKEKKKKRVVNG